MGDKGKRIEKRFFSPPPREGKGGKRTIPNPLKLRGVYTLGGTDSARSTNSALAESGAGAQHTPWVPISVSRSAPHGNRQTNQRHPNLATYNTFLEKTFKGFLILKAVLKWL